MPRCHWILGWFVPLACHSQSLDTGRQPVGNPARVQLEAEPNATAGGVTSAPPATYPCSGSNTLQFGAGVPPDFSQVTGDMDADCFGWQELIALNWPSAAAAGFGDPGDLGPVAWQGYMNNHQLFRPDGTPPPAWGTPPSLTPECLAEAGLTGQTGVAPLTMVTKFSSELESSDGHQAAPKNAPAWLGDTQGNNVWYEIRVSKDEYDFVAQSLYNREGQQKWYQEHPTAALALPMGSWSPQQLGAIELKAAWIEAADASAPRWQRYKLSQAVVVDTSTQKCRALTVALVGLHIIHKTQGQPTWIWATFEHVDNAPDQAAAASTTKTWSFFDPACKPRTVSVPAACQYEQQAQVTFGCDAKAWNQPPQYWLGDGCPPPQPIQVTRLTPIDANAQAANQAAWKAMDTAYPRSVWRNYELINVQWSTNPTTSQPRRVPQIVQSLQPSSNMANTVLETYAQQSKCVDCHQYATISGSNTLPSDFSFLLQEAQPTQSAKAKLDNTRLRPKTRRIIQ